MTHPNLADLRKQLRDKLARQAERNTYCDSRYTAKVNFEAGWDAATDSQEARIAELEAEVCVASTSCAHNAEEAERCWETRDQARAEAVLLREALTKIAYADELKGLIVTDITSVHIALSHSPESAKLAERIKRLEAVAAFARVQWPQYLCTDPTCEMWTCKAEAAVAALGEGEE